MTRSHLGIVVQAIEGKCHNPSCWCHDDLADELRDGMTRGFASGHPGHFVELCSCGAVIAQCRCFDKNKPTRTVERGCEKCKEKSA